MLLSLGLRRVAQPLRLAGRRQASNLQLVLPASKGAQKSALPKAEQEKRFGPALEVLNKWILTEEADYMATKAESKSLDAVSGPAPIKLYGVTGRYATGLYNAAVKAKELGKVDADMKKLVAAAESSPAFQAFLQSPTVSRAARTKATEALATTLSLCTTTKHFLLVLAQSTRTKAFKGIAEQFGKLTSSAAGELTVTLTTPSVLSAVEEKALMDEVRAEFMPWDKVKVVRQYDPEIIEGYVVDFGDKILDKSYGSKLKKLKNALLAATA